MSKSYVIQWKSKVNGRAGRGNRLFNHEDAQRLAAELNREYPDIHHEPLLFEPPVASAHGHEGRAAEEPSPGEADEVAPSFSSR